MKFELVDDANKLYKAWSVKALAGVLALQGTILAFPETWQAAHVPLTHWSYHVVAESCSGIVALLGFIGRYLKQDDPPATTGETK
jgi:hypothetical protein